MNNLKLLTAFLLCSGAVACASSSPNPDDATTADGLRVEVAQVFGRPASLERVSMVTRLRLQNLDAKPIKVTAIRYEVEGGKGRVQEKGQVESGAVLDVAQEGELEFSLPVRIPREGYLAFVAAKTAPVKLKGWVLTEGGTEIPFERDGELALPIMPSLVLQDVQVASAKGNIELTVFLRLVNENNFTLTIEDLSYDVSLFGQLAKQMSGAIGARLPTGAAEEYAINLGLSESENPKLYQRVVAEKQVEVEVSGRIAVHGEKLPFQHLKRVTL